MCAVSKSNSAARSNDKSRSRVFSLVLARVECYTHGQGVCTICVNRKLLFRLASNPAQSTHFESYADALGSSMRRADSSVACDRYRGRAGSVSTPSADVPAPTPEPGACPRFRAARPLLRRPSPPRPGAQSPPSVLPPPLRRPSPPRLGARRSLQPPSPPRPAVQPPLSAARPPLRRPSPPRPAVLPSPSAARLFPPPTTGAAPRWQPPPAAVVSLQV